jgi:hypothetical protein
VGKLDHSVKTLEINWQPIADCFIFTVVHVDTSPDLVNSTSFERRMWRRRKTAATSVESDLPSVEVSATLIDLTKRQMCSDVAKIFDLLGWLTIKLKILLQNAWEIGIDWDTILPKDVSEPFMTWRIQLPLVRDLVIPRCILASGETQSIELHVFLRRVSRCVCRMHLRKSYLRNRRECYLVHSKITCCAIKTAFNPSFGAVCGPVRLESGELCQTSYFKAGFGSFRGILVRFHSCAKLARRFASSLVHLRRKQGQ